MVFHGKGKALIINFSFVMAPELPFAVQPSNFDMHLARIFKSSRNQKIIKSVGLEQQNTAYRLNKVAICTFYSLGKKIHNMIKLRQADTKSEFYLKT